jgi:hypothetical protein
MSTTGYTLTCTGAGGSAVASTTVTVGSSTASGSITIDGASNLATISSRELGTNLGTWGADVTDPNTLTDVQKTGAKLVRWPGGTSADTYHWQDNSTCDVSSYNTSPWTYTSSGPGNGWLPQNSFDNFVNNVAVPGNLEMALTVNYGTNQACNGPGDPTEAATWVAYVKSKGLNARYWTVGNEQYGGWSPDLHVYTPASQYGGTGGHSGAVYAQSMNGSSGFYNLMKAQDPTAMIGAVVEAEGLDYWDGWDAGVLGCASASGPTSCATKGTGASLDYVELHWYAQQPGQESDSYLLNQAPQDFTNNIKLLRGELTATGHSASTPIMLGEFNSVAYNQGKQTMSIANALFTGMMYGEILNDNLAVATMWFGAGGSQGCGNNNSSTLYGWQDFGGYDAVAYNTSSSWNDCGNTAKTVPEGAVFPAGRAAYLVSQFATPSEHMLTASVGSSLSSVRAYAATQGTGYALMLFNLDQNNPTTITLNFANASKSLFSGTTLTYGKAQYDDSKNNVWTGPVSGSLGTIASGSNIVLPPWSMTVVRLQ